MTERGFDLSLLFARRVVHISMRRSPPVVTRIGADKVAKEGDPCRAGKEVRNLLGES